MPQRQVLPSALSAKKDQLLASLDTPPADPAPEAGDSQTLPKKFYVKDDADDPAPDPVATPEATPAEPAASPAPAAGPAPSDINAMSPSEQVEYWRKEAERNEQRWKSFQGQWTSRENGLTDKIDALEKRLDRTNEQPVETAKPLTFDVDMTEEERTTYAQSSAFITKVATQVANQAVSHMMERVEALEAKLGQTQQTVTDTRDSITTNSEAVFDASVRAGVDDLDALTQHAGWRPYASRILPLTGEFIGAHLLAAYKRQDLGAVKSIMGEFREAIKSNGKADAFEDLEVPAGGGSASTGANGSGKTGPKRLKFSMRKQASDDFRKGRISMERFTKIKSAFKEAEAKNLVDYDS